jgi:hypothetical protein
MTAFFTNYLLRQGLSVHVDRNTIIAGYLYIATNLRNALKTARLHYMTASYEPQTVCWLANHLESFKCLKENEMVRR